MGRGVWGIGRGRACSDCLGLLLVVEVEGRGGGGSDEGWWVDLVGLPVIGLAGWRGFAWLRVTAVRCWSRLCCLYPYA